MQHLGEDRGDQDQGQAGGQPVHGDLAAEQQRQRMRGKDQLFETAVFVVSAEQGIEREQPGQQDGDEHDAGRNPRKLVRLGPEREREQDDHDDREQGRVERIAPSAPGQQQVAPDHGGAGTGIGAVSHAVALSGSRRGLPVVKT